MKLEHAGSGKAQRLDSLEEIKKPGAKNDAGKLRYDLLDDVAEEALVAVLTYGAAKYSENGWRKVEHAFDRYFAALRRHAKDLRRYLRTKNPRDRIDYETGFPTSAQLLCNAMFICALDIAAHEGESFDGTNAAQRALNLWNETRALKLEKKQLSDAIDRVFTGKAKSGHFGGLASARSKRAKKKA